MSKNHIAGISVLLATLKAIISPETILPITEENGEIILIVKENAKESKIGKLIIRGLDYNESLAFSLDYSPKFKNKKTPCLKQLSPYLHPENKVGINKGCDLILFTYFRKRWYILLLDLKSNRPNKNKTALQLKNSELFIKYILSLIRTFYTKTKIPDINYSKVYTITKKRSRKQARYQPNNQSKQNPIPIYVQPKGLNKEASIHIGKLLGL